MLGGFYFFIFFWSVFAPKTHFGRDCHNLSETESRDRVPIAIAWFVRFHCPFSVLFLGPFTLSLPFVYHIRSGWSKKLTLVVNYGQGLEMGPWSTIVIMSLLPAFLRQNWWRYFSICYVRMPSASETDRCADRSIPAQLSAYQEYLVTFNLITSKWYKEHDHALSGHAYVASWASGLVWTFRYLLFLSDMGQQCLLWYVLGSSKNDHRHQQQNRSPPTSTEGQKATAQRNNAWRRDTGDRLLSRSHRGVVKISLLCNEEQRQRL